MSIPRHQHVLFLLALAIGAYSVAAARPGVGDTGLPVAVSRAAATAVAQAEDVAEACITCHRQTQPGIVAQWEASTHFENEVTCIECHQAAKGDADGFDHYGAHIATVVSPRDCSGCHEVEYTEFERSHHAAAGNILHSPDHFLAEPV